MWRGWRHAVDCQLSSLSGTSKAAVAGHKPLSGYQALKLAFMGACLQVAEEENDQAMDAWNMSTSYTYHNQVTKC